MTNMRTSAIWALLLGAFALAGCGGFTSGRDLDVPTLHDAAGLSTCSAAKDPLHPLIVEWASESRSELEAVAAKGPVVVSYSGCSLHVLRACHVREPASYQLVSTTPAEQRLELKSSADLYANLPLSAVTLEGKLAQAGGFSLTYVAVGERVLNQDAKEPTLLEGDCDGASHYVDAMVVGAFDLEAEADRQATAKVTAFHGTAGGDVSAAKKQGDSAGDVALCKQQGLAAGASCQAVLSLALTPLHVVSRSPFAVIPALGELRGKNQVDVRLLELVDAARRLDDDGSASSRAKATAWNALAQHEGPYQVSAARRRDDWLRIAEAQEETRARILSHCDAFQTDRQTLDRVLAIDDAVLAWTEKRDRKRAFEAKYRPWMTELTASCPAKKVEERDGMAMIPGGTFSMGIAEDRAHYLNYADAKDAGAVHRVAVQAFGMDLTEVTTGAYRRCVAAGACTAPLATAGCTWGGKANLPVNCVDQAQARAFCAWAGKRLPTEEEWEYAAHPNGGPPWPWGTELKLYEDLEKLACFRTHEPCPVGTKPGRSPFGLADMAGNVWEWTSSPYTADYTHDRVSTEAVIRGGSFESAVPEMLHATYRGSIEPNRRVPWVGFRCAKS